MSMDDRTKKLIAVGASVGANCHPCLEYHVAKALEAGIDRSEIMAVVEVAKTVRKGATASMDKLALNLLGSDPPQQSCNSQAASCCCS
jgi:AhpD family alkylhydroperoxidase